MHHFKFHIAFCKYVNLSFNSIFLHYIFPGTAYGNGVYFAVDASYSLGFCGADANGLNHMFSVQVLVGEACTGQGGMTVLPKKPGGKAHETYDSASDSPGSPNMYIIFHDSQAYPTYHIVFR